MTEILYTIDEWNNALEECKINEWNEEDTEQEVGTLGFVLCDAYTGEKVDGDETILEAVVDVLSEEGHDAISTETFFTVLLSYSGETSSDWEELGREYAKEIYGIEDFPGEPTMDHWEQWFLRNGRSETEVWVETDAGGTFHWFDKAKW